MQAENQLQLMKEKIMGRILPEYMKALAMSATVTDVEAATLSIVRAAIELVMPGKYFEIKEQVEPQSEMEESKD